MRILPAPLTPQIKSFINRWGLSGRRALPLNTLIYLIVLIAVAAMMYRGTFSALTDLQKAFGEERFPRTMPLTATFGLLFLLCILSNVVHAFGSLFLAKDLDVVVSAPLNSWQRFFPKLLEVSWSSSWMIVVLVIPSLLAYGSFFHAGPIFLVAALMALVPFFLLCGAVACFTALIFATFISAQRSRELAVLLTVSIIGTLILKLCSFSGGLKNSGSGMTELINLTRSSAYFYQPWLPSAWAADALNSSLFGFETLMPALAKAWVTAAAITVLAFLLYEAAFERCWAKIRAPGKPLRIRSKLAQRSARILLPFLSSRTRGIIAKEYKLFARDMSQAVQLILLIIMSLFYLFNLRRMGAVAHLSETTSIWWQTLLMLCNFLLGSLIICAVSARFVFPSVSSEGASLWILEKSPIPLRRLLSIKLTAWFIPVSFIALVIVSAGSFALNAEPAAVIYSMLFSLVVTYSLVGLGVAMGSMLAQFEWEHPSQIASSLGALLYMLSSLVCVVIHLIPFGLGLSLLTVGKLQGQLSDLQIHGGLFFLAASMLFIDYLLIDHCMFVGERSLKR